MLDGREHGGIIIADGRHVLKARAVYTRVLTAANKKTAAFPPYGLLRRVPSTSARVGFP